ncbi:MAG: anaerobic sulfatase-maturation protein [Bacteroidales bacterium]
MAKGNTLIFNPLSYPIYVMAKPVGALCNLDCKYCYYLDKEELYKNRRNNRMSEELLEAFTKEYIEAQPTPHVLFTWHGGETLLRGMDFFRKALHFQKKYARGRQITNTLQTNGILLNDEWCRFFKDNNFLIGVSIDGPKHCHDQYRKDKGGHGTFDKVMAGIELMKKHGVEFNILSVVNDYNVKYPLEVYRFFKEIGAQFIQFSPVVERSGERCDGLRLLSPSDESSALVTDWSVPALEYGKFMTAIFDEWVRNDVGRVYVQLFDSTLACFVGEAPGVCVYAKTCGHASAIEFNGDIYSCDHFVFPENKLGNIRRESLISMMLSEKQLKFGDAKRSTLPTQCRECKFLDLCNGECPKNRILRTSDGEKGLNYLCSGLKYYFNHVYPYMQYMANQLAQQLPPSNIMAAIRTAEQNQK